MAGPFPWVLSGMGLDGFPWLWESLVVLDWRYFGQSGETAELVDWPWWEISGELRQSSSRGYIQKPKSH